MQVRNYIRTRECFFSANRECRRWFVLVEERAGQIGRMRDNLMDVIGFLIFLEKWPVFDVISCVGAAGIRWGMEEFSFADSLIENDSV